MVGKRFLKNNGFFKLALIYYFKKYIYLTYEWNELQIKIA